MVGIQNQSGKLIKICQFLRYIFPSLIRNKDACHRARVRESSIKENYKYTLQENIITLNEDGE